MATGTPGTKRGHDDADDISAKKFKQTLLDANYFSTLQDNKKTGSKNDEVIVIDDQNTNKMPRLPPIVLHNELINPKDTYSKIQSWAKNPVHFRKQGDKRLVYATDKVDFILIKEKFRELNFDWHAHKSADEIPKKLVMKGIDSSYTTEEIQDDLKSQYDAVLEVRQMSKRDEDGTKIYIPVL